MKPTRHPQEVVGLSRAPDPSRSGGSGPSASPATQKIDRPVGSWDHQVDVGTLIVGREVLLAGEITSCDRLVIDGSIEGNLPNCRGLIIGESGAFKGCVSTVNADVRGRFDGNLVVRERLLIRSSARVTGTIICGEIEIECGAKISGDSQAVGRNEIEQPPMVGDVAERDFSRGLAKYLDRYIPKGEAVATVRRPTSFLAATPVGRIDWPLRRPSDRGWQRRDHRPRSA